MVNVLNVPDGIAVNVTVPLAALAANVPVAPDIAVPFSCHCQVTVAAEPVPPHWLHVSVYDPLLVAP